MIDMMAPPLVYFCLVNWNQHDDTAECIDSLQHVDYPNYRVIVIDNGSGDGSGKRLREDHLWATVIENENNLGFAAGNNVGMRYALEKGADYVFLLNNDTVVDQRLLEPLVEVAESDDSIGIVGPAIYCYSQRHVFWAAAMEKSIPKGKLFPQYMMRACGEVDRGQYRRVEDVDMINACALLIKRKVIEEIGLLDERFFMYNEDSDWNDRAASAGYRIVYVPRAKIWHKGSVSLGGENSPTNWFYTVRNEFFFLKKRSGWSGLPRLYRDYLRENFWFWKGFKTKGDQERARGVMDGIWCAIIGKGGERSKHAPQWFERLFNWKMRREEGRKALMIGNS